MHGQVTRPESSWYRRLGNRRACFIALLLFISLLCSPGLAGAHDATRDAALERLAADESRQADCVGSLISRTSSQVKFW